MRSGGRWAVAVALLAGVAFAWPTYVRYFGLHPGPMLAALLVAFAMYLPSLWAIRFLDRHDPEPPLLFWGSIAFVILFAPITSRVMHAVIDGGLLPYRLVAGVPEELTKLLPLVLVAAFVRRAGLSLRDGTVKARSAGWASPSSSSPRISRPAAFRTTAGPTCARPSPDAGRPAARATSSGVQPLALASAIS